MKAFNIFFGFLALSSFTTGAFDIFANVNTSNDNATLLLTSMSCGVFFTIIFLWSAKVIEKRMKANKYGFE